MVAGGDGDDGGATGCLGWFAEIAGGEQAVGVPVVAVEQQNVNVAVELSVLEAVVEDVNGRQVALNVVGRGFGLG